jgi:iron transport multicopper oxidase
MNELLQESFTIHFHGQVQRGSNRMDGVDAITQTFIMPGTFFVYKFIADPIG